MTDHQQKEEISADEYDVAIVGGGMAGLTLALQLKQQRPTIRLIVLERQPHPVPEAAHKVGESTVEIAAHYLRDVLGLEEHLKQEQLPKFGLRIFFSAGDNQDITRRVELGHAVPPPHGVGTYQLDRGRLENALGQQVREQGIVFLDGSKVQQIELHPQNEFHTLQVVHAGQPLRLQARWVVDASGRSSLLKRQLGLAKKVGHQANAVWFRVAYPIDIKAWGDDCAWQSRVVQGDRALSTNHLMGAGYWVWLIRLACDAISIGIVTDAHMHPFEKLNRFERALAWLHEHEPQCARAVEQHRDKVQDFRVMKDYSYSCEQVYSSQRWCLTGEAGVSLDPLYSPGSDLIAISNGLICDLINNHLNGEETEAFEERAEIHNRFYLILVNSWLGIYEHQYPLMDNAQIMTAKIIWDTAVYWAAPGLLYFHDAFRRITDNPNIGMNLLRFSLLSEHIQAFFREWYACSVSSAQDTSIRYYDFDFMARLHIGMTAGLSFAELEQRFAANIRLLEYLAGQLVSIVITTLADQAEQEHVYNQLQRWQEDPFLAELIAIYQQDKREKQINGSWVTLGQPYWEKQESSR